MSIGMAIGLGLKGRKSGGGAPIYTQIVLDTFTRADFTSPMGVANTGQTWVDIINGFTVMSSQASPNNNSGTNISVLPTAAINVRIEATLAVISNGGGLIGRYVDTSHYVRASWTATAFNVTEDGAVVIASTPGVFASGDILRMDLNGTAFACYQNGNLLATGVLTRLTGTNHGLVCSPGSAAMRMDNFRVYSIT